MNKIFERPFDFLDYLKGKEVKILVRAYKEHEEIGILQTFDIHLNMTLKCNNTIKFIKGDNILFIEEITNGNRHT